MSRYLYTIDFVPDLLARPTATLFLFQSSISCGRKLEEGKAQRVIPGDSEEKTQSKDYICLIFGVVSVIICGLYAIRESRCAQIVGPR